MNSPYIKPIKITIVLHNGRTAGQTYYTVCFDYSDTAIGFGQRQFMTFHDVMSYCYREYFDVPIAKAIVETTTY